jgi:hypothetical protein
MLYNVASRRGASRPDRTVRVGEVVQQLVDNQLSPRQTALDLLDKLWRQLLPAELVRHSRIAELSGGQLKVQADSASYMYELQLCSSGLLGELQRLCPQVRVKEIKLVLD